MGFLIKAGFKSVVQLYYMVSAVLYSNAVASSAEIR